MNTITANQLKLKGISAIESGLADGHEATITVHGKKRFVVMKMRQYNYLRECELEAAVQDTRADYGKGDFVTESVEAHIKRVTE